MVKAKLNRQNHTKKYTLIKRRKRKKKRQPQDKW